MRSWLAFLRIGVDQVGSLDRPNAARATPIEQLEQRWLLATDGLVGELAQPTDNVSADTRQSVRQIDDNDDDNDAALPNLLGVYRGRIDVRSALGVFPNDRLRASLRFDRETVGGQLDGRLTIRGVGAFDVRGIITGRNVNLSFATVDSSGVLTGEVTRKGEIFEGQLFAQFGDNVIRGNFDFTKRTNFPFLFSEDRDFGLNEGFAFDRDFGFGTGFDSGFGSDITFADGSFGFSPTSPSFGFSPLDSSFGIRPVTRPVSGFVPLADDNFATGFSAGAVLDTPFSAGSVLAAPVGAGSFLTRPTNIDNTFDTTLVNPVNLPPAASSFGRAFSTTPINTTSFGTSSFSLV